MRLSLGELFLILVFLLILIRALWVFIDSAWHLLFRVDKPNHWRYLPPFLVLLGTGLYLVYMLSSLPPSTPKTVEYCDIKPGKPRPILSNSLPIAHLWSSEIAGIDSRADMSNILSASGLLVGVKCWEEVIALNLMTGQVVWRTEVRGGSDPLIDGPRNRLYISETESVGAFSLKDGTRLWSTLPSTQLIFSHTGHPTRLLPDGRLLVYVEKIRLDVRSLNPDTGELQEESIALPEETFLYWTNVAFTDHFGAIQAIDLRSGKTLWRTNLGKAISRANMAPFIMTDSLYIRGGISDTLDLTVINWHTGRILWEITNRELISNIVVADGIVYVLDSTAKLLLLDALTGAELGSIQFEQSKKTESLFGQGAIGGSWLAISDRFMAVYFQDTESLSVYRIERPN